MVGVVARKVVEGEADDGLGTGKDIARITAAFEVALEPGHVSGHVVRDPLEVLVRVRRAGGGCDPAVIEAESGREVLDGGLGSGDGIHSCEKKYRPDSMMPVVISGKVSLSVSMARWAVFR